MIAVCSAEAYTDAPAGPALRAAGLARGLAAHGLEVVLAAPAGSRAPDGCGLVPLDDVAGLVERGATMIISGFLLERYPVLGDARHLVVDAAGPFLLENLVVHQTQAPQRRRRVLADESAVLARLLASADLVLCAHDRQRDLTLGMMLASGALLPELLDDDPGLERTLLLVPFGPTGEVDPIERAAPSGRLHVIWPGGLWDWLDPLTLVEAIAQARARGSEVTAELWGARSPDPLVPPSRPAGLVRERARELEITDAIDVVDWVPHDQRRARLARADAAVTLDPGGIEARFAFRTRLVDALASGLPVIATAGELVADEAAARGAGFTVPPGDPRGARRPVAGARRRSVASRERTCEYAGTRTRVGVRAHGRAARRLVPRSTARTRRGSVTQRAWRRDARQGAGAPSARLELRDEGVVGRAQPILE